MVNEAKADACHAGDARIAAWYAVFSELARHDTELLDSRTGMDYAVAEIRRLQEVERQYLRLAAEVRLFTDRVKVP